MRHDHAARYAPALVLFAALALAAGAQSAPQTKPCSAPEYRQFEDAKMVLASDPATPPIQRITWSQLDGGRVRQLWESSTDGKEWKVTFDGTYTRKRD